MRVTLSVDSLGPNPSGIGRYTWELCNGLVKRDDVEAQFVAHGRLIEDPELLVRGMPPASHRRRFKRLRRWLEARKLASGLVHGPNYFLPDFAENGVITVHDLSVFRFPEMHPVERVKEFERKFASSLTRAVKVITDTETIRQEMIDDWNLPADRVHAVHLGVDHRFQPWPESNTAATLARLGLSYKKYALCVSTLEPRKKIAELLRAWRQLPTELRSRFPLVLAGGSGWLSDGLREEMDRDSSEGWLRYLGYVGEADLPALYAGAALFVYPSIYEGFGLPPLEAMASGIPVVAAGRTCLAEVCGDAALFVDPDDNAQMMAGIERALTDEEWRSHTVLRGVARAGEFQWDRCVERTVDIYREASRLI